MKRIEFITKERSLLNRGAVALFVSTIGFFFTDVVHSATGTYFPSLSIITIIFIGLYSGLALAASMAVVLDLITDYYFIGTTGSVLNSRAEYEHLFFIILPALIAAFLASILRETIRRTANAKQEAEQARGLMEKVLALVSHDIRNPLAAIGMTAQLILRTPGQSDKHQILLQRMLRSLNNADSMIQSLLDVVRLRVGKPLPLDFQFCDLNAQVRQMAEDISLIECDRLKFVGGSAIWGAWGINGIQRALQNLVGNAIKYGEPNNPIVISLTQKDERALLSVHNDGRTISIHDQQGLFEAFQRTHDSEASRTMGWGLGLALVKGIAEAHGGEVKVESADKQGTTFTLALPVRRPEQVDQQQGVLRDSYPIPDRKSG